jgi:hypothetical protein
VSVLDTQAARNPKQLDSSQHNAYVDKAIPQLLIKSKNKKQSTCSKLRVLPAERCKLIQQLLKLLIADFIGEGRYHSLGGISAAE